MPFHLADTLPQAVLPGPKVGWVRKLLFLLLLLLQGFPAKEHRQQLGVEQRSEPLGNVGLLGQVHPVSGQRDLALPCLSTRPSTPRSITPPPGPPKSLGPHDSGQPPSGLEAAPALSQHKVRRKGPAKASVCFLQNVLSWLPSLSSLHPCKEKGQILTHTGVRHPPAPRRDTKEQVAATAQAGVSTAPQLPMELRT